MAVIIERILFLADTNKFDEHWDENFCEEIPATKRAEAQRFLRPLFDYQKSHGRVFVLDAGCGDGIHLKVITSNANALEGSSFVALDISMSALSISQRRRQINWTFVQGDVGKLPFEDNQFDIVYSFGVIAYTDNPFLSFSELCRVTRKGGYIGIWVYPKTSGVGGALFLLIRKACQVIGPRGSVLIADCIVPFLGFLPTRSKMSLANASWRQCREVVLVNVAPSQLYFPEPSEVEAWFSENNIKIVCRDDAAPITLWGEKC